MRRGEKSTPIPNRRNESGTGSSKCVSTFMSPEELEAFKASTPPSERDLNFKGPLKMNRKPKAEELKKGNENVGDKDSVMLDKAQHEIERLTAELTKANDRAEMWQKKVTKAVDERKEAEALLANAVNDMDKMADQISKLQTEHLAAISANERLQNRLDQMSIERGNLVHERNELMFVASGEPCVEMIAPDDLSVIDNAIKDLQRTQFIIKQLRAV